MNQWKFVRIRSNEEDERMPENLDCTADQAMRKLAVLPERRGWMLIAATEGPTTEEELNPRWHTRDVRKRTDARGWILEASNLAPGTWETNARNAVRRAREQDARGTVAVRVWNGNGELLQIVLRARERTSAGILD